MNRWIRFSVLVLLRLLPRVAYPVIRGPLKGIKFILGGLAGEGGGASVYLNMIEPEQTSAFVDTLENGQVVFDIGAHVGYYTMLASRLVGPHGKVFAFEPMIRNIVYLHQHISLNRLNNVTIISGACSDILSLRVFSEGLNCAEGHIGEHNGTGEIGASPGTHKTFPVLTVSVDDVVQMIGVYPDVIKIDVEGAELSVLNGANATLHKARPKIFLSTHSDVIRSACLEYLNKCNYMIEVLSQDKINPSEFLAYIQENSTT